VLTNYKKWPMESASTRMPPAPQCDGLTEATLERYQLTFDAFGLLLETPLAVRPASSLPPDEFESRIQFHQERVAREMRQVQPKKAKQAAASTVRKASRCLPGKLRRADMRIVNCARCSRPLLGESQEPARAAAIQSGSRFAKNFPPPVAARLHGGRPYCAYCAAFYNSPAGST